MGNGQAPGTATGLGAAGASEACITGCASATPRVADAVVFFFAVFFFAAFPSAGFLAGFFLLAGFVTTVGFFLLAGFVVAARFFLAAGFFFVAFRLALLTAVFAFILRAGFLPLAAVFFPVFFLALAMVASFQDFQDLHFYLNRARRP